MISSQVGLLFSIQVLVLLFFFSSLVMDLRVLKLMSSNDDRFETHGQVSNADRFSGIQNLFWLMFYVEIINIVFC